MREREREREREHLYASHLELDTGLLRSHATLRSDTLCALYRSAFSSLSRLVTISTGGASSSSNTLFIDSLRPRGNSSWVYVGNHRTPTFLSLGRRGLCHTIIYRSATSHLLPQLVDQLCSGKLMSRPILERLRDCVRLWSSDILYKLVYGKQGGAHCSFHRDMVSYYALHAACL